MIIAKMECWFHMVWFDLVWLQIDTMVVSECHFAECLEVIHVSPTSQPNEMYQVRSMLVDWTAPYFFYFAIIGMKWAQNDTYRIKKKNKVALQKKNENTRIFRLILNVTSVKCVDANETNTFSVKLVIGNNYFVPKIRLILHKSACTFLFRTNKKRPAENSTNNNIHLKFRIQQKLAGILQIHWVFWNW